MGGALSGTHPTSMLIHVLKAIVERNDLDPALIDDVITGCVMQGGEQALNIGRTAVLGAGFPESVPATTIDRAWAGLYDMTPDAHPIIGWVGDGVLGSSGGSGTKSTFSMTPAPPPVREIVTRSPQATSLLRPRVTQSISRASASSTR